MPRQMCIRDSSREIVNKNGSSEIISVAVACSISLARSGIDLDRIVLDARATRIERATNMDDWTIWLL